MEELIFYRERLMQRLETIATDFQQAVESIPASRLYVPLQAGGMSAHQVAAHLRNVEAQVFLPRLQRILAEESPQLEKLLGGDWLLKEYRMDEPLEKILTDFGEMRCQEVRWLKQMPAQSWSRTARHPIWGVRTLQWWVEKSLAHIEDHLRGLTSDPIGETR